MKLTVKRTSSYGSRPWAIVDDDTGQEIDGPPVIVDHPMEGKVRIRGARFYRLKRHAAAAMAAIHAGLADGSLRWKDRT